MTTTEDTPAAAGTSPRVCHPLDPLTGGEIEAATSILKRDRHLKDSARFVYVTLREPDKDTVLSYRKGQAIDREAHIVLRERAERKTYEAVVSLTTGDVKLWTELPGVQPAIMLEEFLATEEIVRKDPRWQEAMRRRGVTDFDMVMIDPWSAGYNGPEDAAQNGRFLRPLTWVRQGDPDDNGYARPVEGLIVRFDLDRMEVVDIEDHGVVPLPPASGNYTAEAIKDPGNVPHFPDGPRHDVKPREHHPARRHQLHRGRARGALAEVAIPGRLHPARRAGPAPAPVRGPRRAPAGHLPRLAGGDVHPLR